MVNRIALDDLIDGMDMQSDEVTAYLDRDTGKVVTIGDELAALSERDEPDEWGDWEREMIGVLREVAKGSNRYIQLLSKWEVHEWDIMSRFSNTVEDNQVKELLLRHLHGRGAYRRFKDELDRSGLLNRWFDFKRDALREQAITWCTEKDIAFK